MRCAHIFVMSPPLGVFGDKFIRDEHNITSARSGKNLTRPPNRVIIILQSIAELGSKFGLIHSMELEEVVFN
jgi:hypothetical protein